MRAILLVVMVVSVLNQRAEACSCVSPPVLGVEGVPLNARLPVLGQAIDPSLLALTTVDGGVIVPTSVETVPGGFIVVPDVLLSPHTHYTLGSLAGFGTGDSVDEAAPAAPSLGAFTHSVSPVIGGSSCDTGGESFSIVVPEFSVPDPFTVFEVFTGPGTDRVDASQPALLLPSASPMLFGDGFLCMPQLATSHMPNLAVAIRTRDLAGNVSPLSNAVQLKGSAGCSTTGGSAVALLLGIALIRRRKIRSA